MHFEDFRRFLAETLNVAEESLHPEASFLTDLAIDSLRMVELVLRLEARLGMTIPVEEAWNIQTVGDAYAYYAERFGHATP
ncbi:MAG TPA: acyl carrier protein [Chloroflexi bacterium]|nr:acyl carrier protein [Chloroflexota bacterium]